MQQIESTCQGYEAEINELEADFKKAIMAAPSKCSRIFTETQLVHDMHALYLLIQMVECDVNIETIADGQMSLKLV